MSTTAKLFTQVNLGGKKDSLSLDHRVVMAPLTRCRAVAGECEHTDLGTLYYSQRASKGGLIIAEASQISTQGQGYPFTPGCYSDAQVEAWKKITDAVHQKGGLIFLQLWHVGRVRYEDSVSSSDIAMTQVPCFNLKTFEQVTAQPPKSLSVDEIKVIVDEFGAAAKNAIYAGFDGVEIHGATGYLIDQFIQDGVNKRTDEYGGSIENRLRFLREVVESVLKGVNGESNRVGVRISPSSFIHEMSDSTSTETFTQLAKDLDVYDLAYLHVVEPRASLVYTKTAEEIEEIEVVACKQLRPHFKGPIIAAGGFNRKTAIEMIENGHADLIAFGRHFISAPDLPLRLEKDLPLNKYDRSTFYYAGGDVAAGYTDYPFYKQEE